MYALGIVLGNDHINVSMILGMKVGGYVWSRGQYWEKILLMYP